MVSRNAAAFLGKDCDQCGLSVLDAPDQLLWRLPSGMQPKHSISPQGKLDACGSSLG
jgi:hypothetical protein